MTDKNFLGRALEIIKARITKPEDGSDQTRILPTFRPAMTKTPADLSGLTELRVHGVGGTPPENLLGEPSAVLVAGDQIAGFYRGSDRKVGEVIRHVEAYSWGGLTSRSSSRAWWLLLLPFAFVNVAGWMQTERKPGGLMARLIRAMALTLTATYVLWISVLSLDMLAYQCGGAPDCYSGRWWLSPLENELLSEHAGRRLVAGALIPLAFILLLVYLGRKSRRRYEEQPCARVDEAEMGTALDHPDLWRKSTFVKRLGRLHLATALATLALAIAYPVSQLPKSPETTRDIAGIVAIAALVELGLLLVACFAIGDPFKGQTIRGRRFLLAAAISLSAVTLIVALCLALFIGSGELHLPDTPSRLPGVGLAVVPLFRVQQVLAFGILLVLFVQRRLGRHGQDHEIPNHYWQGPFVLATLAFMILDAVFSGASIRFADFLGAGVAAGESTSGLNEAPILYAVNYLWFAIGFTIVMVLFFLFVFVTGLLVWRQQSKDEPLDIIDAEFGPDQFNDDASYQAQKQSWLRRIAMWRFFSRLADKAGRLLTALIVVAFATFLAGVGLQGLWPERWNNAPEGPVVTAFTWFLSLLPLIFILGVRRGEKNPELRRKIGVLWDVLTVWPRHYHPFAPPCYAERAIPDLQKRIMKLAESGGVILSGHSQGAVLSVMTMAQLPLETRRRVALVTYGSPVTRLYRRFFVGWFGGGALKRLGYSFAERPFNEEPPRWQNFFRKTDPIGGPTFLDPDTLEEEDAASPIFTDEPLLDPRARFSEEGEAWPPVAGHSHYLVDPLMIEKVDRVAERLSRTL
jgi:hypothetical protein